MPRTLTATASATPTYNKACAITNNSSVDIVVLDAYTASDAVTAQQIYEQTLKPLSTTDGQKIIRAGATGTVTLDDTHKDSTGADVYTKIYNLVIARADNLYPIVSLGAMATGSRDTPPYSYKPITITADEAKNMQQAEIFQQTIMAYPTANLAKDFQAAMTAATDNSDSDTDVDDAVTKFFSGTKGFQNVTLNMIVAINTYYSQFPYVWAGYKSSKSYYLYTSDGTACTYKGSVQINAPSTVPASTDHSLPGFNITYTDESNNTKKLYYQNGQFVDDINSDTPAVCLQGLFILKSQLTKKDADTAVISILSGTAGAAKVLGYDEKQQQDKDGNWSGLYTLLHPKDAMGWIQLFMTFMGVFMGVDFIVKALKGLKDGILEKKANNDGNDPAKSEVDNLRTEVKNLKEQVDRTNQDMMDKMDKTVDVSEDLNTRIDNLQKQIKDRLNEDQRSLLDDNLDTQSDLIEQVLEYGNTTKLDDLDDAVSGAQDKLDNAATEDLDGVLPEVKLTVGDVTVKLKVEVERVSSKANQEAKESMKESQQELDDAKEMSDKIDESTEDAKNGDVPEDAEFDPMEFSW